MMMRRGTTLSRPQRRNLQNFNGNGGVITCGSGMSLVFVASEVGPWSKTGGLGDVLGGLPPAMAVSFAINYSLGFKIFVVLTKVYNLNISCGTVFFTHFKFRVKSQNDG